MKPTPTDGRSVAAQLLQEAIQRYERDPALRRQSGMDLKKLAEAGKVRRQLLKQRKS